MYYVKKIQKLENHVNDHPKDYQAVIALLIAKSDHIAYRKKKAMDERKAKVAMYRRMLNEREQEQHVRHG